jgi:hypothetical protein
MNIFIWLVQILLAFVFVMAGATKLARPVTELAEQWPWVEDFTEPTVKFIGAAETLGAIGLILPAATGIAPVLVPIAAAGLATLMVLAAVVHWRRGETPNVAVNVILLLPAAFVAWQRFGDHAF